MRARFNEFVSIVVLIINCKCRCRVDSRAAKRLKKSAVLEELDGIDDD